ncbi:hypothetical protein GCK72_026144 [Caenorhabditis remanei]|uniref:Uncharacterized protein n=1 Tax=Caenorhabditis remanei TaxID=31234 RepID=A0A6A5G417_CAERE|nr:hypothetical protein GCK72_026144 [Caenorhabditis remanei]KAF1749676.1 hypothetical protein GCK72_026144 [Caenorhabditis remanei]
MSNAIISPNENAKIGFWWLIFFKLFGYIVAFGCIYAFYQCISFCFAPAQKPARNRIYRKITKRMPGKRLYVMVAQEAERVSSDDEEELGEVRIV